MAILISGPFMLYNVLGMQGCQLSRDSSMTIPVEGAEHSLAW